MCLLSTRLGINFAYRLNSCAHDIDVLEYCSHGAYNYFCISLGERS